MLASSAFGGSGDPGYEPERLTDVEIYKLYGSSVLPIYFGGNPSVDKDGTASYSVGSFSGTGFVVDAEHGLILTANHVLEKNREGRPIYAAIDGKNGLPLLVRDQGRKVARDLNGTALDVALVEVSVPPNIDPEAGAILMAHLARLQPIPLSFWPVTNVSELRVLFFDDSQSVQAGMGSPRHDEARDDGSPGDNPLSIVAPVTPGSSGSPLFDSRGCVRGICIAGDGFGKGLYQPIADSNLDPNIFLAIRMTKTMSSIDARLISSDPKIQRTRTWLEQLLVHDAGDPNRPSNNDLFAWADYIAVHRVVYEPVADLVVNPIRNALIARGVVPADAVLEDAGFHKKPVIRYKELLNSADAAKLSGDAEGAINNSRMLVRDALRNGDIDRAAEAHAFLDRIYMDSKRLGYSRLSSEVALEGKTLDWEQSGYLHLAVARADVLNGREEDALRAYEDAGEIFSKGGSYREAAASSLARAELWYRRGETANGETDLIAAANYYGKAGDSRSVKTVEERINAYRSQSLLAETNPRDSAAGVVKTSTASPSDGDYTALDDRHAEAIPSTRSTSAMSDDSMAEHPGAHLTPTPTPIPSPGNLPHD